MYIYIVIYYVCVIRIASCWTGVDPWAVGHWPAGCPRQMCLGCPVASHLATVRVLTGQG